MNGNHNWSKSAETEAFQDNIKHSEFHTLKNSHLSQNAIKKNAPKWIEAK